LVVHVGVFSRSAAGQITAVIGPDDVEAARSGERLVVVAHVCAVNHAIATELGERCCITDRNAGRKCNCCPGNAADPPIVLKQVVACVFLAAVIENTYPVAGWRDDHVRLPLVSSRSVVIHLRPSAPSGTAIGRLDEIDVRLVGVAGCHLVVVSAIDIAAHRVHCRVWEPVTAEPGGAAAVDCAGEAQIAIRSARGSECDHGDSRAKGNALVGGFTQLDARSIKPPRMHRVVRIDSDKRALNSCYDQCSTTRGPSAPAVGRSEEVDAVTSTKIAFDEMNIALS